MTRSSDYSHEDYNSYVKRIARAPIVLTDVPHRGHMAFNNTRVTYEEHHPHVNVHHKNHHHHKAPKPEFHESVQVIEYDQSIDDKGNIHVHEEMVDVEADRYIQQRHKGFELWK